MSGWWVGWGGGAARAGVVDGGDTPATSTRARLTSRLSWLRFCVPLKMTCSRKCADPLLAAVSYRDPASIHIPTHAVPASHGDFSLATRRPDASVVTSVGGPPGSAAAAVAVEAARARTAARSAEVARMGWAGLCFGGVSVCCSRRRGRCCVE